MANVKAELNSVIIFLLELATTVKKLNSLLFRHLLKFRHLLMSECILTWYCDDKDHKRKGSY